MLAQDIMIRKVYKVKQEDKVRAVIEKFIDHRISGLPVVNDRNEIVGYMSDGDIMRFIGKKNDRVVDFLYFSMIVSDPREWEEKVTEILDLNVMTVCKKKVVTASWNTDIDRIAAILGERNIKKLPIERNGVLVGIISRGDVIRHAFGAFM
ncbi:CBS domain-containing protein [Paenibacillus sp. UNCCL117]|uniref:CBS domain-containing protein n=1 Tax=unclassified Paenibacillus TaxID=185978 RepID=UPI0008800CAF|nr:MULTISPECIES: CBS domain-containing protein [unclassified Paenibacillus]SDD08333.1 CBS domain-containing protein [Paenibacillus sp. cl123]SFW31238.1 CBS domain-containing protein [Paenibacillus sp. UNCCL117]